MSQAARTVFSILAYRIGGLPLSAAVLLAVGVLWWIVFCIIRVKRTRKIPLLGWLPTLLCTICGGGLLFLFCEDRVTAAAALFCTALLYALPFLLLLSDEKAASKGGDRR